MTSWTPVRKILAAIITAFVATPAFMAWLSTGTGFGWREALIVLANVALPIIVGYLVPAPKDNSGPTQVGGTK